MTIDKEFNPIVTARRIEKSYRDYIATTIHFDNPELQSQLEKILEEPEYLSKGPFLEAAPPYCKGRSIADLVHQGVLCRSMLTLGGGDPKLFDANRPLYIHQERAIFKAIEDRNYAVVTGTGSGKTECFLLPILNDIFREFEAEGPSAGVRAMILYPMNALANDQLKRLRELLSGTGITFGRYTGDTKEYEKDAVPKWAEENPRQSKLPNEIISREEIRKNPPNILLTNYSMLEYLLLRPEDSELFGAAFGSKWRHIAIDEAHIYSGALGTEIAYLIRRLKARIANETGTMPRLHCYATSATIGSEDDMPKVAEFAQDLFGEPFSSEPKSLDVITSEKDEPAAALDVTPWGMFPLSAWGKIRRLVANPDKVDGCDLVGILKEAGVPSEVQLRMQCDSTLLGLGQVLLGEESCSRLVRRCAEPFDLTNMDNILQLGIPGLEGDSEGVEILSAMVEVLSVAERTDGIPILSSRYHSFLRAPEGVFINLFTGKLTSKKSTMEPYGEEGAATPVYEVSVCRHCGQAYVLASEESVEGSRASWLNPVHEGTYADDDFVPRKYYRLLNSVDDRDEDEHVMWLCPICGSLHSESEGGVHLFEHESCPRIPVAQNEIEGKQADEVMAKCHHCGYRSRTAIQPMRVSPEAAGSVVCYDLVRDVPPFESVEEGEADDDWFEVEEEKRAGSVICFSDKRQDAAFFAPSMERTYGNITRRQIIREAVEELCERDGVPGCSIQKAISWIAFQGKQRYPRAFESDSEAEDQATAWMLDEMTADDSRNSLSGLGIVRLEATRFIGGLKDPRTERVINRQLESLRSHDASLGVLTCEDYKLFSVVSLETLREQGCIEVPEGVVKLRKNHEQRGNIATRLGGVRDGVSFVGEKNKTENRRSSFIRKYLRQRSQVDLSREQSIFVLDSLFDFLEKYLGGFFKSDGYLVGRNGAHAFQLNRRIWMMYPHGEDDIIYRCDVCGCETHLDTRGVCLTHHCGGRMQRMTFADAYGKDRFYKEVYQEEALPIQIEEHTAQLSRERARQIQSDFIRGDVNILSCTTTFELGVDVGDLRAVFMRNIPPSTANYTQRAGRVGRRAGKPGYAVTFARLRPHDISYFENPRRIIEGETRVPACYLDNKVIAMRHLFAIVFSEFFRFASTEYGADYSHRYHDFMDMSERVPEGLKRLSDYLSARPRSICAQLDEVFSDREAMRRDLGIEEWSWVDSLVGEPDQDGEVGGGRLFLAHDLKYSDYMRLESARDQNQGVDDVRAGKCSSAMGRMKKDELTISVLAESGVLPKYGFPTDLVSLKLDEIEEAVGDDRLALTRGLRQAIREYAPGCEVVAGKSLWVSERINRPYGHGLEERRYGKCRNCGTFVWPVENYTNIETECPVCHRQVTLSKSMLVPAYGFRGSKVKKPIGLSRPRSVASVAMHFSQHWEGEIHSEELRFPGGRLSVRYASNGQMCAINAPRKGYWVCSYCGAASVDGEKIPHSYTCKHNTKTPQVKRYDALGAAFVTDVLELAFDLDGPSREMSEWESVMWAVFSAAAELLQVPETEIGGTVYRNEAGGVSIMIYDDVPGGAGHAYQLSQDVRSLVESAYGVVDGHCGCGEETCCYGCIANYYNQVKQHELSRGAAKAILGMLLGGYERLHACGLNNPVGPSGTGASEESKRPCLHCADEGASPDPVPFEEGCLQAIGTGSDEQWERLLRGIATLGEGADFELPWKDVEFEDDDGASAFASLVWKSARLMLLDKESIEDFNEAFACDWRSARGWTVFCVGECEPDDVIHILERDA